MPAAARHSVLTAGLALLVASCAAQPSEVDSTSTVISTDSEAAVIVTASAAPTADETTEEVRFRVGPFELVGDLHLPAGAGPHGAVVLVHGSGPQTRTSTPTTYSTTELFRDAGYAVLVWDKPGSGASTGEFSEEFRQTERATILTAGIETLLERDDIDPSRIGAWGLSEGGWVIPRALTMTDEIDFVVVVSGGGEDSIENMVYQWGRNAACGGESEAVAEMIERHGSVALKASKYDEFRGALEQVIDIPNLGRYVGVEVEIPEEAAWTPWPRDIDAFLDPMDEIERVSLPILVIYGEGDHQVDPRQGAEAYRTAFEESGHPISRVVVIPGVGHILTPVSDDGCVETGSGYSPAYTETVRAWLSELAKTQR